MSYRIDHTKTTLQNIVALLNDKSKYPIAAADIASVGVPTVITPGAGNGNNNTQVVITGNEAGKHPGQTTVQYNRFALSASRPKVGTRVLCTNADTHATIQAKILAQYRLVAEEVTFTNPFRRPEGGEELVYTVTPKANSSIYLAGSFNVGALNISELTYPVHPSFVFGDPVRQYNGLNVYQIPTTATSAFVDVSLNTVANFTRLLNLKKQARSTQTISAAQITYGTPVDHTVGTTRNYAVFGIGNGTYFTEGGYIEHVRADRMEGFTAPFYNNFNPSVTVQSGHPYYERLRAVATADLLNEFRKAFYGSTDSLLQRQATTDNGTYRTVWFQLNGNVWGDLATQMIYSPFQGLGPSNYGTAFIYK